MQEGGENFCKYSAMIQMVITVLSLCTSASAIQQKGHSHFGAMANFKEICGAILRVCYPYQQKRGRLPPFYGNRTFTLHKRLRYLAKGHSHFGAMAFCCALNERIPQAETKKRCDSASLLPVPTEKGAFAPFCWYG